MVSGVDSSARSSDDDLEIRLDYLTPPGPPTCRVEGRFVDRPAVKRLLYVLGAPDGAESQRAAGTRKFRVFNGAYVASIVFLLVMLVCVIVAIAAMFGPRRSAIDLILIAVFIALGAGMAPSVFWGMCVVVTDDEVIVRRQFQSTSVSRNSVSSAEVQERVLMLKPVIEIDLGMKDGGTVRTPLLTSRITAGRVRLNETVRSLRDSLGMSAPSDR